MDTFEKKYNEALNWMRELYPGLHGATKEDAEHYFPELRESEDERIRKWLVAQMQKFHDAANKEGCWEDFDMTEKAISYLEKQKEQKSVTIVRIPKFRVGDIIQRVPLEKWDSSKKITSIDEHGYNFNLSHLGDTVSGGAIGFAFEDEYELVEQKPAELSEKYIADVFEKVGLAKIAREQGNDALTNAIQSAMIELSKVGNAEWSDKDMGFLYEVMTMVQSRGGWIRSDDAIENVKSWLNALPERFNLQPKQEWSEEDERMIERIVETIQDYAMETGQIDEETCGTKEPLISYINFLRSLRPQPQKLEDLTEEDERLLGDVLGCITLVKTYKACGYLEDFKTEYTGEELRSFVRSLKSRPRKQPHWKPSDEQMEAFEESLMSVAYTENKTILESLYEQLKKLM